MLKIDMAEATRLTRLGRLGEAMALLRGGGPATPPPRDEAPAAEGPTAQGPTAQGRPFGLRIPAALRGLAARLGQSASGTAPRADTGPAPLPPGARFDEHRFTSAAGSRSYKLFVPSGQEGRPLPLLVMLHGCTQSPDDFALGTGMNALAEAEGFIAVYPAQDRAANPAKCWNWFSAADQQRDRGEPALIAGITRRVIADQAVDPRRVYIAGLSAGGAAAAVMGAAYPDLYAAVGVHSGLACGAASDMASAFTAMKQGGASARMRAADDMVPTIVFHGDGDTTVSPVNGDQVIAHARAADPGAGNLRVTVRRGGSAGGITYTRTTHSDAAGRPMLEQWVLHGAGHAWSGGSAAGSYTEPRGPAASPAMLQFFLQHATAAAT